MAHLLVADGWVKANSLGLYLREALPDDYVVVADASPYGRRVAAAVVARRALFVVDDREGEPAPGANGSAPATPLPSGTVAVEHFLRDEFPGLQLPAIAVRGERDWAAEPPMWRVLEPADRADAPLADAILDVDAAIPARDDGEALSYRAREELGMALRDRQLTVSQRASKPFVFRSGGAFRTGTRAWTVRGVVAHMERYPADGEQALRDGTLARWCEEEGAHHLAALAREVTQQPRSDMRGALERFLQGAGLVTRPRLVASTPTVKLGYVLQGAKAARQLEVERRGRGYLYGDVSGAHPWLRVEPRSFEGAPARFVVTADTGGLQISADPYLSAVVFKSNAGEEPVRIPVSVRVVAGPGKVARRAVRPPAGLLAGGALGALIGWLGSAAGLASSIPPAAWIGGVALFWALAGLCRGALQPPAWPVRFALSRWVAKAWGWSVGLGLLAVLIVVAWRLGLGGGLEVVGLTLPAAFFAGAALGVAPATVDELAQSRYARDPEHVHGRRAVLRPILTGAGIVTLIVLALLAPRAITSALGQQGVRSTMESGSTWIEQRLGELGDTMDAALDRATLWYYNRPAAAGGTGADAAPNRALPQIKLPEFRLPQPGGG